MLKQPIYGLQRAAQWLEDLINGTMEKVPLLDVSAFFGDIKYDVCLAIALTINKHLPGKAIAWGRNLA